ncbi:MAG: gliding motility-associated ABC transporter substrate-binding protein GldG [Cyclobacteriaceae bacterium]|jgi:ABC-2 type transport system permease protein
MIQVFRKEMAAFLNSLIAYVVMGVFLICTGLLVWVFPDSSVLDFGFADLGSFFAVAPYVLLFLIPAITMRSLAEERKLGTLEWLLTKPVSETSIVLGKYVAAFSLALLALLPTVVYVFSLYRLGNPVGNLDVAGTVGSYIGLLLLAAVFSAIGLLASATTHNQIISFVLAAFGCYVFFSGFDLLAGLITGGQAHLFIRQLGLMEHYQSLSRGVIDSRDVFYFGSVIFLLLALTRLTLRTRHWEAGPWMETQRTGDGLSLVNALLVVVLASVVLSDVFFRVDLTEEKRYTIKPQTRELLQNLDDVVQVEVFLAGDLNPGFARLQQAVRETLNEFRIYSGNRVQVLFTDPAAAASEKARQEYMAALAGKGIQPLNVIEGTGSSRKEKFVFPGAIISVGNSEIPVMLLKGNRSQNSQEVLNQSIENLEYEFSKALAQLAATDVSRVGWLTGHNELTGDAAQGAWQALAAQFDVSEVRADELASSPPAVLVVAKPTVSFSELDKYRLDQYIMKGGRVLWLIDRLDATMDSASRENYFAFPYTTNLDDQLFRYGIRINPDLVQDRVAASYPIAIGELNGRPRIVPMEWPFWPLVNQYANHPITRNLDAALFRFASSVDTVKAEGVRKTPLMMTSEYSRKISAPVNVSVNDLRQQLRPENFQSGRIPVAYLLEGEFTSLYRNRFVPAGADERDRAEKSKPTKMVVVADGDLARNEISQRTGEPQPLGYEPFSRYTFANADLLVNTVAYLADENGLIASRAKEVKLRPLDKKKIESEKAFWQLVNVALPLLLVLVLGVVRHFWRKRRYASVTL